ncbi:MAG TPA: M20/M25/M40 family metallo-hydrolase [Solirubrobacteraceae bacterium]|nr:M20/M25/M40 family metallo-hydrolase [Solirubrobacteraceae bacterium]
MSVDPSAAAQRLLAELLRFKTVNPPGAERPAQEHLAAYLRDAGFECSLLAAEPERPNLVARLRGELPGPTLCYLGHVDTVLADPREWRHDPFGGELIDGFLWGRGAIDMKSQVAAEAAAAAELARAGWRPRRGELLIVSVVDEETGGELGAQWITREHAEEVRCDMLINEGAGELFEVEGARCYGLCCAEKGVFRFTLTTSGVAAHASLPALGENALLKMAPLLARFAERSISYLPSPQSEALLAALGEKAGDPAPLLARLRAADERLAAIFEPLFGITFAPTRITASEKINVIPSRAELKVDCRVPPGGGASDVEAAVAQILGPAQGPEGERYRLQFTEQMPANASPVQSELADAIAGWLARADPGARLVPVMLAGFSDSRHFRAAFPDCVAYGFFPQRHQTLLEAAPLVHGADERIDVRDLAFAAELYRDLALAVLGSASR